MVGVYGVRRASYGGEGCCGHNKAFHQTLFPRPETECQRGDVAEASSTEEKVHAAPIRIPGKEGGEEAKNQTIGV